FQRRNEFFERRQAGLRYIDLFVFHDAVEELGIIAQWAWSEHHGLTCSQADQNMMPKSVSGFRTTSCSNYMRHDCLHGIAAEVDRSPMETILADLQPQDHAFVVVLPDAIKAGRHHVDIAMLLQSAVLPPVTAALRPHQPAELIPRR
ncbi:hypothetical protein, partial [Rhizobium leguminosarum]|uniref:hypothetical protein n=1 Tax=Rhizobium leguminosarum TaxID=384 RepID=UPI00144232D0